MGYSVCCLRAQDLVYVARAPGRLDVMGGIADYSGALVLQMPVAEACHAAVQVTHGSADPHISVVSLSADQASRAPSFTCPTCALYPEGQPLSYEEACTLFKVAGSTAVTAIGWHHSCVQHQLLSSYNGPEQGPCDSHKAELATSWAAYVVGCLLVLSREQGLGFSGASVSILVSSQVPEGKGVSSSAAVEVAVMQALLAACGQGQGQVPGRQLALLCQRVENLVVGAPCGIMDQMASALGEEGALLALLCQPAEVQGCVALPSHLSVWGVDSGLRHSVGGADYGSVRSGAFMGLKIGQQLAALPHSNSADTPHKAVPQQAHQQDREQSGTGSGSGTAIHAGGGEGRDGEGGPGQVAAREGTTPRLTPSSSTPSSLAPAAAAQGLRGALQAGYLVGLSPSQFSTWLEPSLPESMTGQQFLALHGAHVDPVTRVLPEVRYAVRQPAAHPVHEHHRVRLFRQLLQAAPSQEQGLLLGELMLQSHASYSACGLGSHGTDRLVEMVVEHISAAQASGRMPLLFGAKITGGGSGGTVCILGSSGSEAEDAVQDIVSRYQRHLGLATPTKLFKGSSMGASTFGCLAVKLQVVEDLPLLEAPVDVDGVQDPTVQRQLGDECRRSDGTGVS
ncbi:hypothetical protein QJQ45_011405 [Haematococcus lacustris]|nr:hypothetical protein QJQ45_011405 [Haematococcus lacustris]